MIYTLNLPSFIWSLPGFKKISIGAKFLIVPVVKVVVLSIKEEKNIKEDINMKVIEF